MTGKRAGGVRATYHRGNTRSDAIAAGHALLSAGGVEAVTTVAVAARLNVSRAAVARAFPSISDLHAVLAEDCVRLLGKDLAQAEDAYRFAEPQARWAAIAHAYLAWSRSHPHEYALVFRTPSSGEARPLFEESGEPVPDAFELGLPPWDGDPAENPAFARWALLHGLATLLNEGPLHDLDAQSADRVVNAAVAQLVVLLTEAYRPSGTP